MLVLRTFAAKAAILIFQDISFLDTFTVKMSTHIVIQVHNFLVVLGCNNFFDRTNRFCVQELKVDQVTRRINQYKH